MPHFNYYIDYVVGAFIVRDGKVLLVNHRKLGVWLCPGGHIELDEDPVEAVHREVMEETGLRVKLYGIRPKFEDANAVSLIRPTWLDIHRITDTHRHTCFYWAAKPLGDGSVRLAESEHSEIEWFPAYELPDPMWPATRYYCREAVNLVVNASDSLFQ